MDTPEDLLRFRTSYIDVEIPDDHHLRKEFDDGVIEHIEITYIPSSELIQFHVMDCINSVAVPQRYCVKLKLSDLLKKLNVGSSTLIEIAEEIDIDEMAEGSYFCK